MLKCCVSAHLRCMAVRVYEPRREQLPLLHEHMAL